MLEFLRCEEPPPVDEALQLVFTPVSEAEPGTGDRVDDGPGDQHLARARKRADSGPNVYSNA